MPNFFSSFSSLFRLRLPVASCPCFVRFLLSFLRNCAPFPLLLCSSPVVALGSPPRPLLLCCMLPNRSLERCVLLLSNPIGSFVGQSRTRTFTVLRRATVFAQKLYHRRPRPFELFPRSWATAMFCVCIPPPLHVAGKDSPVERAATGRSANRHCVRKHRSQQQCQRQHTRSTPFSPPLNTACVHDGIDPSHLLSPLGF
jgi:hypothetical protein